MEFFLQAGVPSSMHASVTNQIAKGPKTPRAYVNIFLPIIMRYYTAGWKTMIQLIPLSLLTINLVSHLIS